MNTVSALLLLSASLPSSAAEQPMDSGAARAKRDNEILVIVRRFVAEPFMMLFPLS
ncbi:hypothetical protein AKJ09_03205 [Labilithrix luteola]|uniref:Uncharacterized protein n=1 Tax=Labilithrix luteola TaxID=1391654 RepID=A0A0K1PT38_9BACT|nr:hypothetical protein AKJ09_03205 [Labilithrix luteola]